MGTITVTQLGKAYRQYPEIRGQSVLLDSDVAQIYGVETKRINEAVKNNPDQFPQDYMLGLSEAKFSKTRVVPNAFTEKGLYMLATILRSKQAVEAAFAIIETFSKIRELSRSVKELSVIQDKAQQKSLLQRSGELIAEILDDDLQTSDAETSIELNFAVLEVQAHDKEETRQMMCCIVLLIRHEVSKPFVLSLSKHEGFHGLRQAQAERSEISLRAGSIDMMKPQDSGKSSV